MAESMCGPSNALNTFQKHTSVDRTLQQDRLVHRQTPPRGFRSTPGPNTGLLDPEFEAFQAGHPPVEQSAFSPPPHAFSHAPLPFQQSGPMDWASDFQRMSITGPPTQAQPFSSPLSHIQKADLQHYTTGGWHQEFGHQQRGTAAAQRSIQSPVNSAGMGTTQGYGFSPMASGMSMNNQYMGGFASPQAESSITQQPEVFDEEAFARAFEEAAQHEQELAKQESDVNSGIEESTTAAAAEVTREDFEAWQKTQVEPEPTMENLMEQESDNLNLPRIGADAIRPQDATQSNHNQQESPDALARTAGQLLESVRDNQSTKFQESTFFGLMRALRDKEAVVRGDNIVDVSGNSGVKLVIDGSGSNLSPEDHHDVEGDAERAVGNGKGVEDTVRIGD
ncbi:hypothetical protein BJ875DRAFT_205949 [Amylocarpus encephaloides]|uniref:Peroxin 20 n=1 Tax=Amylocarpus encephaloides TaxID=45428 RepID=A0A9P7Y8P7_9HELO|nr:hypothetical protein BJ875DRAFT_205949 [Amylocarpus encephaloides]